MKVTCNAQNNKPSTVGDLSSTSCITSIGIALLLSSVGDKTQNHGIKEKWLQLASVVLLVQDNRLGVDSYSCLFRV